MSEGEGLPTEGDSPGWEGPGLDSGTDAMKLPLDEVTNGGEDPGLDPLGDDGCGL